MKQVFFTLASGRSGTLYLRELFRNNVRSCASRHEPFFDWGNPTLFGPAVYDAYAGRLDALRERLEKKRRYIERLRGEIYLESNHSFLKSAYLVAPEIFPDMRLIHLIRDPLRVAKSEAYRLEWRRRVHAPFHFYTGDDGHRHFCWALTGNEPIFQHFAGQPLSCFQWHLIQWIEIENRAMQFLDRLQWHDRCFTMDSPRELNEPDRVRALFNFFNLQTLGSAIILRGRRNKSIGYRRAVTPAEEREADEILARLPEDYLEIFSREPYRQHSWAARLRPRGGKQEQERKQFTEA